MRRHIVFLGLLGILGLNWAYAAETNEPADKPQSVATTAAETKKYPGVPLHDIIAGVAERTHKRIIIDPRVRANVEMQGMDLRKISYQDLQAILRIHGFSTLDTAGIIRIVPDANARQSARMIEKDSTDIGEDEVVTKVITVTKGDATAMVPILRVLIPQYGHLVVYQPNTLIICDYYSNVKRIEKLVHLLDKSAAAP